MTEAAHSATPDKTPDTDAFGQKLIGGLLGTQRMEKPNEQSSAEYVARYEKQLGEDKEFASAIGLNPENESQLAQAGNTRQMLERLGLPPQVVEMLGEIMEKMRQQGVQGVGGEISEEQLSQLSAPTVGTPQADRGVGATLPA